MKFEIVPFTPSSDHFAGAVNAYVTTWSRGWAESRSFFLRYAAYPDYIGRVAVWEKQVVGMGFGARTKAGQWWHDRVAARVGPDNPALQDAWVLVELAVLQGYRGDGIGTALHDTLLAAQPCRRVLLSTEVSNLGARRLYERLGWGYLHPGFVFAEGGVPYVIMCKESGVCGSGPPDTP